MRTFWTCSLVLVVAVGGLADGASAAATRHLTAPPTSVSSRYVVVGDGPVLRVRNTVYVGGVSRLGVPTGSAMVVATPSGQQQPIAAQVTGGAVQATIVDGAGGWYIGGTFTSVGGVGRPGLAHLLADGTLDTAFVPPPLGQVRALALDNGRLYVGGIQPLYADPWFQPALSALDPATGALLPVSYPWLAHTDDSHAFGVIALAAANGRLFAAFNGDNGIAAYDEGSGAVLWSRPGTLSYGEYSGPATIALAGGRLLVGGQISTPAKAVDLEELDPATGAVVGQPAVDGPVAGIAAGPTNAFLLVRSPHISGVSIWKLGLSSGTLSRVAVVKGATAIALSSPNIFVAGQTTVGGDVRVSVFDTGQAKPSPRAFSPVLVGGSVGALALQSGHLFVGGSFLGTGGPTRGGLAAFDAETGALLPWRPAVPANNVAALASSGNTIYLAGAFKHVSGKPRTGLAAVSALGTGKLLPWHPRLSQASFGSLVVAQGRVFAGGSAKPPGAHASTRFRHLLVFSARSGRRLRFDSRIGHVNLMAGGHGFVVTENSCGKGVGRPAKSCVTAFRVDGVGRAVWRKTLPGVVLALHATVSTLYVGGQFSSVAGHPRSNLAALALDKTGRLLSFAPEVPLPVSALAQTDYGLVFGTNAFRTGSGAPYFVGVEALGAVSPDGTVLPWAMSFPPNAVPLYLSDTAAQNENFLVAELTPVPGGLVARGDFSWIGPDEDPAPGTLVWLR
jgi:outer membrane protein assembly factor BamB